jgi:putative peptidoglycan lipid II flippase
MITGFSRRGLFTVFSATVIVTIGTLVAKAVGFGKELFVAYELGPGAQLDAFLFAYVFPALLINVIGGALIAAFVPQYLETSARSSPEDASRLGAEAAFLVGCAQFGLMLILVPLIVLAVPMLTGGFDQPTQQLTRQLIPVLLPLVLLNSISSCWAGMLNAHGRFATVAFVPTITPLMVVLALVVGRGRTSGALLLAIGTMTGALIEFGLLAARTRLLNRELFRVPESWRPEYTSILKQFWPAAASSLLMSATLLVDQTFAAQLPQGSVSALSYGTRLTSVAATIFVAVVSAVALPAFSRLVAERRTADLRRAFCLGVVGILVVSLPFAAVCSIGSEWLVEFMYVRGEFTSADAIVAASVQSVHAWHIPVYAIGMLAVRGLAAMRATWLMLVGSALSLGTDLVVNSVGVPRFGVAAIGFATTAMYMVSAVFLAVAFLSISRRPP